MTGSPEVIRDDRQKGNVSFPMERREPEATDDARLRSWVRNPSPAYDFRKGFRSQRAPKAWRKSEG